MQNMHHWFLKRMSEIQNCSFYLQQSMDYLCSLLYNKGSDKKIKVLSKLVFPKKSFQSINLDQVCRTLKEKIQKILSLFSIGSLYQVLLNNSFVFFMKEMNVWESCHSVTSLHNTCSKIISERPIIFCVPELKSTHMVWGLTSVR